MVTVITVLVLILSILLILVVLIQKPKGGGLTAGLTGSANQLFGVRRTSNIVEKATWIMSGAIAVLLLVVIAFLPDGQNTGDEIDLDPAKEIEQALDNPAAVTKPNTPTFNPNQAAGAQGLQQAPQGTEPATQQP